MRYEYQDNAFWEDENRTALKCIRLTYLEDGTNKKQKDILQFRKYRRDGSVCPNFKEVVEKVGIARIDKNTEERHSRKRKERAEEQAKREQKKKTSELESLFNMKIKAFEIEEIKNSEDRALRTRLRRSKNSIEMNAIASIIIAKELGYIYDGSKDTE